MKRHLRIAVTAALLFITSATLAQDFMMQGWYWDYPKTAGGHNWSDTMQVRAASIAQGGFTYVWLPPFMRSSSGSNSNGYDPYDLYDLGGYGLGPTGFGSDADVANVINTFNTNHIKAVADVIYNHRNGGIAENNPVVQDYVNNAHSAVCSTSPLYNDPNYDPYPSDRFRYILPLGGSTGNGAGDYYIKISSISGSSRYYNAPYTFYAQTNTIGYQNQPAIAQTRPDGGGDCGQGDMTAPLGVNINSAIADVSSGGCGTDEYHITLTNADFNPAGDTLFIYISNQSGQYSDHRIYGLWSGAANSDIASQLVLQTYTDFTHVASGQGQMNYSYFHPNGTNCSVLGMDWDYPSFYYDYDQSAGTNCESALIDWTKWLWSSVGIRGLRMDDVKAFNPQFVGDMLSSLNAQGMDPGLVVGEFFDYNAGNVINWINAAKSYMSSAANSAITVRAFDFPLRQALKNACDVFGTDVRSVYSAGIAHNGGGGNAVTFINNHDLRDAGQPVQNNPLLAYAYIFTDNSLGVPSMFYSDYFGISLPNYPTVYLKPAIDSVIALHKKYIYGSPTVEYLNSQGSFYENSPTNYISSGSGASSATSLIYQISGGPSGKDVIVAINFAGTELQVDHLIDTHNGALPAGTQFYDAMKRSNYPYAVVSNDNTVYLDLPPFSFSIWVNDESAALPVNLTAFTAENVNNNAVLKWTTAQEENNKGFVIEKSADNKNFDSIGMQMSASPSSTTPRNYRYTDIHFSQDSYYRLKQLDLNNTVSYSSVLLVKSAIDGFKFFITKEGNRTALVTKGNYEPAIPLNIILINAAGQVLLQSSGNLSSINEALNNRLSASPSGVYFLKILYNKKVSSVKFIH